MQEIQHDSEELRSGSHRKIGEVRTSGRNAIASNAISRRFQHVLALMRTFLTFSKSP